MKNETVIKKTPEVHRDRVRGSLVGGAVGDALGYPVEFMTLSEIKQRFGEKGITAFSTDLETGAALISDDTQMSLFTANGILYGYTRGLIRGIMGSYEDYVYMAYKEWLITQTVPYGNRKRKDQRCWLMDIPDLFSSRAPGNTCMGALHSEKAGAINRPVNNSKGCGGVMRVAPFGLFAEAANIRERAEVDRTGAEIAALTHGHPLGWLPAAILTHIVNMGIYDSCGIREAVEDALETVEMYFSEVVAENEYRPLKVLIEKAIDLSSNNCSDEENIGNLGEGWTGEEALAIAVYCALRYPDDFSRAVIAAVNHSGDSDSTGAIAGNIVGAWVGYDAIEEKWTRLLEMRNIILEMADDLAQRYTGDFDSDNIDPVWMCKYYYGRYSKSPEEAEQIIRKDLETWEL